MSEKLTVLDVDPKKQYPGLDVAYDRASQAPLEQARVFDSLIARVHALFALGTAFVGIGVPIGLGQINQTVDLAWIYMATALIPGVTWIIFAALAWLAMKMERIQSMTDPTWAREELSGFKPDQAKLEFIAHAEIQTKENREILDRKAKWVTALMVAVLTLAIIVLAWSITVVSVSSALAPSGG